MFQLDKQRKILIIGFLSCVFLMATALGYFQYWLELEPCPLCVLQRIIVIAIGMTFLVAAGHNPKSLGRRIYASLIAIISVAGLAIAGRHIWLQNLPPDQVPACGPGLDYMLEVFPLDKVMAMVFQGSGECAEVLWQFLGLTIPGWMLLVFASYLFFAIILWRNFHFWR